MSGSVFTDEQWAKVEEVISEKEWDKSLSPMFRAMIDNVQEEKREFDRNAAQEQPSVDREILVTKNYLKILNKSKLALEALAFEMEGSSRLSESVFETLTEIDSAVAQKELKLQNLSPLKGNHRDLLTEWIWEECLSIWEQELKRTAGKQSGGPFFRFVNAVSAPFPNRLGVSENAVQTFMRSQPVIKV